MFLMLFLLLPSLHYAEGKEEITAGPGDQILLSCPVNTEVCGAYHSLKWYHEDTRVYVFSPSAQFKNAEGALMNRCLDPAQQSLGPACVRGSLEVTATSADLRISPVELTDEGEYRCEITYLDISNNCPVVHFTEVVTLAAPESVGITDHEDEDITGQVVGPYAAGEEVVFSCQAEGGKPAPAITWMFGDEVLEGDISEEEDMETGSWNVRSELVVLLAREHTGATLSCIVEHEALDDALEARVQVDVNVPVSSVSIAEEVSGQEDVEMTLTCTAVGGRPSPTFSWIMPDNLQFQQEDSSSLLDDETFESVSKLTFTPSYEENGKEMSCQAINDVMEEALEDMAVLSVEYAPQVNIKEGNETAAAGDDLIIDCEITANPEELFNIKWFHNDNPLDISDDRFHWENTGTPSLSITPVQPSDAGVYSCSAENSVGHTRSPLTYSLEVNSAVQSVAIQDDLTRTVGHDMTIVCISTGARPAAVVEWFTDAADNLHFEVEEETKLLEDNTYKTTNRLKLIPHKGLDGMEVSCQAVNDIMEEAIVATAELNILYPPIVTIEEENITASTGEELIIECDIEANPENLTLVQWYHNGVALDLNDARLQSDTPAHSFTPVQASDAGEYYCYAENEVGKGQSNMVKLSVISVVESVIIEDVSGIEAQDMVLTCVATGGRPASTITWVMPDNVLFREEEEVFLMEEEPFQTVSKLTFTPSAMENEKKVSCQAINEVMEEAVEYETELNIHYKPIVTIEDENLTVTAGDEVTLECMVEANPMNLTLVEWFHNEQLIDTNDERFEDGNPENPSLTINPVLAEDAGDYFCLAQNQLGQSRSNSSVSLLVIYPPTVEIRRDPTEILKEEDDMNVTLHCEVVDGNPLELTRVYWFMNDELIRQLPDPHCDQLENGGSETLFDEQFISEAGDYELGSGIDGSGMVDIGSGMEMGSGYYPESDVTVNYLCDVDPTELFLQHVTRDFSGNFSCSGNNNAGEGPASEPVHLDIFYIPGQSLITQEEDAQKGESVTLLCNLEDHGNPIAATYKWRRGEESLDETSANLTLDNLSADSQSSFSCAAANKLGQGRSDTIDLVVFAPPTFIQRLPDEATFLSDDMDFDLQCQVECSPLCSIKWMKNEVLIDIDNDKYNIVEEAIPDDIENNQFQSLISKLSWNLENLANNKLDHNELNFTISCFVEETEAGEEISSSSQIEVEYAPENIEISTTFILIEENEVIDPTFCYGEGVPEPSVVWKFQDQEITSENTLDFVEPMTREQGGVYSCHIENEHGLEVVNVTVDVLYKPECSIDYRLEEEDVVLVCKAEANPEKVKFWWEKNNMTFGGQRAEDTLENEVRLKTINESVGVYLCYVNNSIGDGEPCMIDLTMDMMTYGLSEEVTVILIAVAGSGIVLLIIIIITACLYCGEKKHNKGAAPMKKNKSKSPLLKDDKDDKVHADSSFYENLPFKGLKSPPKQVVDDRNSDMMDYADADYLDIYANGPLKYRETSEKNATLRRQKIEQRKSDLL